MVHEKPMVGMGNNRSLSRLQDLSFSRLLNYCKMRFRTAIVFLIIGVQLQVYSQSYSIQEGVKRIVFIGNSITYAGTYVSYVDAYFSLINPEKKYKILNLGLPSETVSGLSELGHANGAFPRPVLVERLESLLTKTKPDLVLACYGMNDGIYLPFDEHRFEQFKKGINALHDEVKKRGVQIIHLTPPVYDGPSDNSYAEVLEVYSDWLVSQRNTSQWKVIDIHRPMKKELQTQRLLDPNFSFAKDGIHPNKAGHFLMAKEILLFLGAKEINQVKDMKSILSKYPNGPQIAAHIKKRQQIIKDAWLTYVGHKRPRMNPGFALPEAQRLAKELSVQIENLLEASK